MDAQIAQNLTNVTEPTSQRPKPRPEPAKNEDGIFIPTFFIVIWAAASIILVIFQILFIVGYFYDERRYKREMADLKAKAAKTKLDLEEKLLKCEAQVRKLEEELKGKKKDTPPVKSPKVKKEEKKEEAKKVVEKKKKKEEEEKKEEKKEKTEEKKENTWWTISSMDLDPPSGEQAQIRRAKRLAEEAAAKKKEKEAEKAKAKPKSAKPTEKSQLDSKDSKEKSIEQTKSGDVAPKLKNPPTMEEITQLIADAEADVPEDSVGTASIKTPSMKRY